MWQIAFLLSVLLSVFLPQPAQAARKMFVRDIVLHGDCVKDISVESLRALLAQEMPRDILEHRGLAYEDLSPYLDAGNWNAESFTVREARNVMNRVRQFDMQLMLWLEVSCLPGSQGSTMYVLTGRLMDLDRMDAILTCQDAQAKDQRRVCHSSGDIYDAVTFAQVDLDSFARFVPAVRHLLARLLRIPEIELRLDQTAEVFDVGQLINLSFSVRRNDERQQAPIRMIQKIIRVPPEQRKQICREPAQYWEQRSCASGSGRSVCPESVPFQVIDPVDGTKTVAEGGPFIQLRAPSYEDDFLVRAEAVAHESGGDIRSVPTYRCLQIRERRFRVGVTLRGGTPLPSSTYDSEQKVSYDLSPVVFGIDLSIANAAIPRRQGQPGIGLVAVLGGTFAGGQSSVADASPSGIWRKSTSWTTELRGQLRVEYFRFHKLSFTPYGDIGFGLEQLSSNPQHESDGVNFLLMAGVGACFGGQFGLNSGWDLNWSLGLFYQFRFRISHREGNEVVPVLDALGVPTMRTVTQGPALPFLWQPLWVTLGLNLASPRHPR